jgi:putative hydrolase of the HAD superfamily
MVDIVAFDLWDTLIFLEEGWKTFTQLKPFLGKDQNFWRNKIKPLYLFRRQKSPDSFLDDLRKELGMDLRNLSENMSERLKYDIANTKLYPDAISTLDKYKKMGKKLAVVSNQCSFYIPSFYSLGLDKYFDFVLFSCDLGYGKPDKRMYQKLVNMSNVESRDILMIGDHEYQDYRKPIELGFRALNLARNSISSNGKIKSLVEISLD